MELKELCDKIDLAPEIQSEVLGADLRIPDELAARMISTDTADEAYGEIEKLCDPEKHGFDMLACMLIIVCLEDRRSVDFRSAWLYIAAVFLILYYIVWIRYFAGGRDVSLLGKSFMFVPIPLAVFPVLYYLFGAIWLRNLPAAILMLIFGFAHITISYRSFGKSKTRGKYSKEVQRSEDTK